MSLCVGNNTTLGNSVSGGAWSVDNPSVASISATGVVSGIAVGTTNVTYMSACGASTAVVGVYPFPSVLSPLPVIICLGQTVSLNGTPAGGLWTSDNTSVITIGIANGVAIGVSLGTSLISYRVGICAITTIATVQPGTTPVTGTSNMCVGDATTFSCGPSGGLWSSSNTSVAYIDPTTGIANAVGPGVATIIYNRATCYSSKVVSVNASPGGASILGPTAICIGSPRTLSSSVGGGTWSSGNPGIATVGASSGIVSGASPGTAIITYSLSNSCGSASVTTIVTVNSPPSAITGGTTVLCPGATTTFTASPPGGAWISSNGAVASATGSGAITAISAGVTSISYTVAGCSVFRALTVNPAPVAGTIMGTSSICTGGMATFSSTLSGGSWSSSNGSVAAVGASSGVVSGIGAGTAVITYTRTNSCGTALATTVVTVGPLPPVSGSLEVCTGKSGTLSNTLFGGTWSSSNPSVAAINSSSGVVTGAGAGMATITYRLGTGCLTTAVITVNASPNAGSITGPASVCEGATITLTNAVSGGTWAASGSSVSVSGGVVSGLAFGTGTISYTATAGLCSSVATKLISVVTAPVLGSISGTSTVCAGTTTVLTSSVTGGSWSSGDTSIAKIVSGSGTVTGISAGTAGISYTRTNLCGSTSATVDITVTSPPPITGTMRVCKGFATTLFNSDATGTWVSGNVAIAAIDTSGVLTGASPGTVTITYSLGSGCISTTLVTVDPMPSAGTLSGDSIVCVLATGTLSSTVGGGIWDRSNSSVAVSSVSSGSANVTGVAPGVDTIRYTVSIGGCSDMTRKQVTVNELPSAGSIVGPNRLCQGMRDTLTASVPGGTWYSSGKAVAGISPFGIVTAGVAGNTTINYIIVDTNGCADTATMQLQIITPQFTVSGLVSHVGGCYGGHDAAIEAVVSGGNPPFHYSWSNGDSVSYRISGLAAGTYSVMVQEPSTRCALSQSYEVKQADSLSIVLEPYDDTCRKKKGGIRVIISGGEQPYQYLWSTGATADQLPGLAAGEYSVVITDAKGCARNLVATVENAYCSEFIVHDVITPNGDGQNEMWVIEGLQNYSGNTVQIFDKWGDIVYEKDNYKNDWNGASNKGSPLPDGTYYYLIRTGAGGSVGQDVFKGSVMIKR